MKRFYNLILTLVAATLLSSCIEDKLEQVVPDDHTMSTQADTLIFTIAGGVQTMEVTTDVENWIAGYKFEEIPWFTFSKSDDGKSVSVTVESNYTTDPREALLKITAGELFKYIVIQQESLTPYFELDRDQFDAYFRGQVETINVNTNVNYQITTESWVKAVKLDGGAKLELTVLKNVVETPRTANIKLFGSNVMANISITQGPSEPLPFIPIVGVWEVISYTSEERTGDGGAFASYAIDGNLNTFWHSRWTSTGGYGASGLPQDLVIDMKSRTEIEWLQVVRRQPSNAYVKKVEFFISDDNVRWKQVGDMTFLSTPPGNALDTQLDGAIGRYLKLSVVEASGNNVAIAEINAKGYADPLPILDRSAWEIVSFTSQEEAGEGGGVAPHGRAEALLDGDPLTYWHSIWWGSRYERTLPQEIVVDMKSMKTVSSVLILNRHNGNDGVKDVQVYLGTANTAASYQNVGTVTYVSGERGIIKEIAVDNVQARYVKLVMPNSYQDPIVMALAELYVWGTE